MATTRQSIKEAALRAQQEREELELVTEGGEHISVSRMATIYALLTTLSPQLVSPMEVECATFLALLLTATRTWHLPDKARAPAAVRTPP